MRRVASRLCEAANKIRKGQGKHLQFQFGEERGYTANGYLRRRKVDRDLVPTAETVNKLRDWLAQEGSRPALQLVQGKTHVAVSWHDTPQHPFSNFFSTMPAEAYSLEDNPLHEALNEKARQLASPDFEGLRCVVVADAGSRMLRRLDEDMRSPGTVTGRQVIENFLGESGTAVDVVLVLSPHRTSIGFGFQREPLRWQASMWCRPGLKLSADGVTHLVGLLPRPRFEGYQARSLQQQAAFHHEERGWYVGTSITSGIGAMTIRISARAFLDLMAGRITLEQFQSFTGLADEPTQRNIFAHRLNQGDVLSSVRIEPKGLDEDDDWLVIDLKQDPSAGPLKLSTPPTTDAS